MARPRKTEKLVPAKTTLRPALFDALDREGRTLTAKDAKAAGLIDRIATMDETLARLTGAKSSKAGMRAEDEPFTIAAVVAEAAKNTAKLQAVVAELSASAQGDGDPGVDPFDEMKARLERY